MQTNQSRVFITHLPPFSGSCSLGHYPPALNRPWPGTKQPETAAIAQRPLKYYKLTNPKLAQLAYAALSIPSCKTTIKSLAYALPAS